MKIDRRYLVLGLCLIAAIVLIGCAPGNERWDQQISPGGKAGFWAGLWHGLIIIITFICSLFTSHVRIYEISNTGWPYNLGFVLGLCCSMGAMNPIGKHKAKKRFPCREEEWDQLGDKIASRVREGMKDWVGKEEREKKEQESEDIARKVEEKVRKAIKDWLDKP